MAVEDSVLDEASRIVYGKRREDYGPPSENHGCTAKLWNAWLSRRFRTEIELTAADVCVLNMLQKLSRHANAPLRDNLVDIAGYAENAFLCTESAPEESGGPDDHVSRR